MKPRGTICRVQTRGGVIAGHKGRQCVDSTSARGTGARGGRIIASKAFLVQRDAPRMPRHRGGPEPAAGSRSSGQLSTGPHLLPGQHGVAEELLLLATGGAGSGLDGLDLWDGARVSGAPSRVGSRLPAGQNSRLTLGSSTGLGAMKGRFRGSRPP